MTLDDLQSITRIKGRDARDIVILGAQGELKLYTIMKKDIEVSYCYAELNVCPTTGLEQLSTHDPHIFKHYSKWDIIELPVEALKELRLNGKLKAHTISKIFPAPPEDCKLNYPGTLDMIKLDDVYVDPQCLENPKKEKVNKQQQREALFSGWLEGQNTDAVSNMRKEDVWEELRKIDSTLFNASSRHFFRNQKMITFKAGRKFQQTGQ